VIDRPQSVAPQQLGQAVCVHLVTLVPLPGLPPPIADEHLSDQRRDEIVQPLGLRPFLEGHVNRSPHAPEELGDRTVLRR
jgi:hypothetical protein